MDCYTNLGLEILESESKLAHANGRQDVRQVLRLYPERAIKGFCFSFQADQKLKVKKDVENKRLVIEKLE